MHTKNNNEYNKLDKKLIFIQKINFYSKKS